MQSTSTRTQDVEPILGQCWADVVDAGPALTRLWFNGLCLRDYVEFFMACLILLQTSYEIKITDQLKICNYLKLKTIYGVIQFTCEKYFCSAKPKWSIIYAYL